MNLKRSKCQWAKYFRQLIGGCYIDIFIESESECSLVCTTQETGQAFHSRSRQNLVCFLLTINKITTNVFILIFSKNLYIFIYLSRSPTCFCPYKSSLSSFSKVNKKIANKHEKHKTIENKRVTQNKTCFRPYKSSLSSFSIVNKKSRINAKKRK